MVSHPSGHVCGCYYIVPEGRVRRYLPQLKVDAHTTILSSIASTHLTQTYRNPTTIAIDQIQYSFPLFDGVAVVEYEVVIGNRTIKGIVQRKDGAKATYKAAVDRGETAGLLEQLPAAADVFISTIGNVPAKTTVYVNITYVGELKHDSEVDGIRMTIPTAIAPRYGSLPGDTLPTSIQQTEGASMQITVDIVTEESRPIKKIISPSHPLSINVGNLSADPDAVPAFTKGSATLALGTIGLEKDFVLQVLVQDVGSPRAMLETHAEMPNQRAIMATLVPKFALKSIRPEIIIVVDRSGSMRGNIPTLVSALEILLKSLPVGVRFNICSFGNSNTFLWPNSQAYDQSNVEEALAHVQSMKADYGGTETLNALKATIEKRCDTMPTELILLTDGAIWPQAPLFAFINEQVEQTQGAVRLFAIGIGDAVSSASIEGLARAGNGAAQMVLNGERLDSKIMRMLKASLTPHMMDYTLEINYRKDDADQSEDDFELIEKVSDCLMLDDPDSSTATTAAEYPSKRPILLYDPDGDADMADEDLSSKDRYGHLPNIEPPRLLQTPNKIPPLYAFSRTCVYVLMSSKSANRTPDAVTLRATSPDGPLELRIPVDVLATSGKTIHQLAAKKAIQELEEGRGWLVDTKDASGKLVRSKHAARFDELLEREAVRLGVEYQVGGKWCSFVAVESREGEDDRETRPITMSASESAPQPPVGVSRGAHSFSSPCAMKKKKSLSLGSAVPLSAMPLAGEVDTLRTAGPSASISSASVKAPGTSETTTQAAPYGGKRPRRRFNEPIRGASGASRPKALSTTATSANNDVKTAKANAEAALLSDADALANNSQGLLSAIIRAQTFSGTWVPTPSAPATDKGKENKLSSPISCIPICTALRIDREQFDRGIKDFRAQAAPDAFNFEYYEGSVEIIVATGVVIEFLRRCMRKDVESWELVEGKACRFLSGGMWGEKVCAAARRVGAEMVKAKWKPEAGPGN